MQSISSAWNNVDYMETFVGRFITIFITAFVVCIPKPCYLYLEVRISDSGSVRKVGEPSRVLPCRGTCGRDLCYNANSV